MQVALVGNIAGIGVSTLRFLRSEGINAHLFLSHWELGTLDMKATHLNDDLRDFIHIETRVAGIKNPIKRGLQKIQTLFFYFFLSFQLLHYDVIQSFTGALFSNPISYLIFGVLKLKPYIACATGSDIREAAFQKNHDGERMRRFFQESKRALYFNIDMVDLVGKLTIPRSEFFPFMIDTKKFSPGHEDKVGPWNEKILFFMPSHLDWGVIDNKIGRNSTKGNDRFIRAFARYVKQFNDAHAIILDRGPDRVAAKDLVDHLGIKESVTFLPGLSTEELIKYIRMCDVVVDQFDIGAFGYLGLEAMSCAKPVLIYIKNDCADKCYANRPPVLNAHTEEEIYEKILSMRERSLMINVGQRSREWIMKYHDGNFVTCKLIKLYQAIIGENL